MSTIEFSDTTALTRISEPVTKFPDFVRHLVKQLRVLERFMSSI